MDFDKPSTVLVKDSLKRWRSPGRSKESELCPADSPTALFGFELRRHRKARGWSQIHLSKAVPYFVGTISMIETARRSPTEEFARHCDEALEAEGALTSILQWVVVCERLCGLPVMSPTRLGRAVA